MMNIGEFARRTGLSISAIRFYGDRGLLEPIDIDPSSGYRSYAVDQVEPARMIADLRRMNMPLVDIERVLESSDIEQRSVVLEHVERLETAVDRAHDIAHSLGAQPTRQETPMTTTTTSTTSTTSTTTMTATLDARSLGQALEQVLPAAGRSASQPHLMCVLIESKDGSVRFVATDSHRLSIRDVVPSGTPTDSRAVVAADTVREWGAALSHSVDVALATDGRSVTVTGDEIALSAAIVPVTFPDYEPILVTSQDRFGATAIAVRHDLVAAFDSFDASGAVLLSTSGEGLTLQRRDVRIDVAASCEGPDVHVALDPRYVADALSVAVGVEAVIEIADALRPVILRSADDGTYTSLLMPVKLD